MPVNHMYINLKPKGQFNTWLLFKSISTLRILVPKVKMASSGLLANFHFGCGNSDSQAEILGIL